MAKYRCDPEIGRRMHEEISRIFSSYGHAGYKMKINIPCISQWKGGAMPNAYALQRLALCGGDVIYVLTGERSKKSEN